MAGRKQTTPEQEKAIWDGFVEERSAGQIHRKMAAEGLLHPPHANVTVRLVQSRLQELRETTRPDESGTWSFVDADPEEARLVLDVAAAIFDDTNGRVWPTKDHAAWIVHIRTAAPEIPPRWANTLAVAYQMCVLSGRDTRPLDYAVGMRLWKDHQRVGWFASGSVYGLFAFHDDDEVGMVALDKRGLGIRTGWGWDSNGGFFALIGDGRGGAGEYQGRAANAGDE